MSVLFEMNHVELMSLLKSVIDRFYVIDKNMAKSVKFLDVNINIVFYIIIIVCVIIYTLIALIKKAKNTNFSKALTCICLFTLVLYTAIQSIRHSQIFNDELTKYHDSSISQQVVHFTPTNYNFAQYAKSILNEGDVCSGITDIRLKNPKHLFTYFSLRYYMYPLSLPLNSDELRDCIILYAKKDATKHVPKNYIAAKPFNKNGVIAFKRNSQ